MTALLVASPEGWQVSVPGWVDGGEGSMVGMVMVGGGVVVGGDGDGGGGWC